MQRYATLRSEQSDLPCRDDRDENIGVPPSTLDLTYRRRRERIAEVQPENNVRVEQQQHARLFFSAVEPAVPGVEILDVEDRLGQVDAGHHMARPTSGTMQRR